MNPTFDAIVVVAAWIGGGLITYGAMKANLNALREDMEELKKGMGKLQDNFISLSNSVAVLVALEAKRNRS